MPPATTPTKAPMRAFADVPVPLLVLGTATVAGLFFTAQIYLLGIAFCQDVSWAQAAYWAFGDWYEWALLSPLMFGLCRLVSGERVGWTLRLTALSLGAVVFSGAHAAMCAGMAVLQGNIVGPAMTFTEALRGMLVARTPFNLVACGAIFCAWHVWQHYRGLREREAQLTDLRGRLAQAQLLALRMQLNPHFLYNTLNAVSSLMLTDVRAANRMLTRLGDLLRVALDGGAQPEIPLSRELAFLESYLEIERIRFGDRLRVRVAPASEVLDAAVPNFVLQPLVENAIRHAIEHRETEGEIALCARREADRLVLEVQDNGPGPDFRPTRARANIEPREHVGLTNTRQRLEKLYGAAQHFVLRANEAGGMTAIITIPFRPAAPATA